MTSLSEGLTLTGVGVRFDGLTALEDVSLTVAPGQIMGVAGPNGAGKTTLFNVICGVVKPRQGTMTWQGAPLAARPHQLAKLGIGRIQQTVGLLGGMTVLENVMTGIPTSSAAARAGVVGQMFGLARSDRRDRQVKDAAMAHLQALGIVAYAHNLPDSLPLATRKRVALARALIAEPKLLLLDEPAAGLTAGEIDELGTLIRRLPSRPGRACSVMLIEHRTDLVMRICDTITVLDSGRVIESGPPGSATPKV